MRIVDANLLLYSVDSTAVHHEAACAWLDAELSSGRPVGFAWAVLLAFVRVGTNPRIFVEPLSVGEALDHVEGWLAQPNSLTVAPGRRHAALLRRLLEPLGAGANLASDAHLAALAIEHGAVLCSGDYDFARFAGLRWENPLAA